MAEDKTLARRTDTPNEWARVRGGGAYRAVDIHGPKDKVDRHERQGILTAVCYDNSECGSCMYARNIACSSTVVTTSHTKKRTHSGRAGSASCGISLSKT